MKKIEKNKNYNFKFKKNKNFNFSSNKKHHFKLLSPFQINFFKKIFQTKEKIPKKYHKNKKNDKIKKKL